MLSVLAEAFGQILKLLHPFVPFVTEYIYQRLDLLEKQESIMISEISNFEAYRKLAEGAKETDELVELISRMRKHKLDLGKKASDKVSFACKILNLFYRTKQRFEKLANVILDIDGEMQGTALVTSVGEFVLVQEKVDAETLRATLLKDIEKLNFEIERSTKMLSNEKFVAKAPEALVAAEKEKLEKNTVLLNTLQNKLKELN